MGEARLYRAAWLLPISRPPLRDAWLTIEGGLINGFGEGRSPTSIDAHEQDLGEVAIVPGLVNAHTHLELSWMRGRIAPTEDFPRWIRSVMSLQRSGTAPEEVAGATRAAIREARAFGTVLCGDISNTLLTPPQLLAEGMPATVFHELIGFRASSGASDVQRALERLQQLPVAPLMRYSIAAHAPYSVSPALFSAIAQDAAQHPFRVTSVHMGESAAEIEFLQQGTGPWKDLLDEVGVWNDRWAPPESGPVEYLDRIGLVNSRLIAVHGVHLDRAALARLAESGATLVTCPRGNMLTGAGAPPLSRFYESGVAVAIGTDSLASVPDLNLFAELATMKQLAPDVPSSVLLASATLTGAAALGFEREFGAIEKGKLPRLLAVELRGRPSNVEDYLVSGVDASQIRWIPEG